MIQRIHLEILRSLDEKGTLALTAEELSLTQPALSHSIRKLEGELGLSLWQREGRRIRLTRAGEVLLAAGKRIIPQLEETEELLQEIAKGKEGLLRVGIECHPCYRWFQSIVREFLQKKSRIELDLKEGYHFDGVDALARHDIDLLITPDPIQRKGLLFEDIFSYELVLAVSPQSRLAGKDYARPEDLKDEVLITYPVEKTRLDIYTRFLLPSQAEPKRHKTIEATDIMMQLVSLNRGVTSLPDWFIRDYYADMPLKILSLGPKGIQKSLSIGIREEDETVGYLQDFITLAELNAPEA